MRSRDRVLRTRAIVAASFAFALSFVISGAGCGVENAIVGGDCREGYSECSQKCVDLASDANNCGVCANVCGAGIDCVGGVCGGKGDGSDDGAFADGSRNDGSGDGSGDDGSIGDGSNGDGSGDDDGSNGDGSALEDGSINDGSADACVPPFNTVQHCGACFNTCAPPNDECVSNGMGGFLCAPFCVAPLERCANDCVDKQTDGFHCGACFKQCPSGICAGGICQGATPGDVVVIGHDFSGTTFSAAGQTRLLTNAVFIPRTNPLRILSYEQFANAGAVAAVKVNINNASIPLARNVAYTVSNNSNDLTNPNLQAMFDVVLVYDQENMTNAEATTIGTTVAASLTSFTTGGGVVVALDGAGGSGQMPTFLTSSALLAVTSHLPRVTTPGTNINLVAGGDAVGTGVLTPYRAGVRTATFVTSELGVTVVARAVSAPTDPVVVHKTVP